MLVEVHILDLCLDYLVGSDVQREDKLPTRLSIFAARQPSLKVSVVPQGSPKARIVVAAFGEARRHICSLRQSHLNAAYCLGILAGT
jgi:hypothetical protein